MEPQVTYRDEDHSYWKGSVRLPSVTTILRVLDDYADKGIDPDVLRNAAERGTKVHAECEFYDEGYLDEAALEPSVSPYVRAWIRFRKETGFKPIEIERLVHHPSLLYAGRLDRVGVFPNSSQPGMPWVIDIKTSALVMPVAGVQMAGYAACLDTPHRRAVAHLRPDDYKLVEFSDRDDWKTFQAALAVWRWKQANCK